MSDADALWLSDPMEDFSSPRAVDSSIVASRGNYPQNLGQQWGATLCMGFVLFRAKANRGMEYFVLIMKQLAEEYGDDQKAVNIAVSQLGIQWDAEGSDMRYEKSTEFGFGTIDSLVGGEDRPLTVTLLPHSKYTRHCGKSPLTPGVTVVAHCRSPKKAGSKMSWMYDAGLWSI